MSIRFRILQWNCQSVNSKKAELEYRALSYDIILLSETWLNIQNPSFKIKGFDTIRQDRLIGRGGGVAILIRKDIKYASIPLQHNCSNALEACAIKVEWEGYPLIFVSIYKPPDTFISVVEWSKFISQFQHEFFIGGDINAHHTSWGNTYNCANGLLLYDAYTRSNATLLNNGSHIYRPHWKNSSTAIDLTLVSPKIYIQCNWKIVDENWSSDHRPICVELSGNIVYTTKFKNSLRHHSVKTDWDKVDDNFLRNEPLMRDLIQNVYMDTQTRYTTFLSTIISCVRKETPGKGLDKNAINNSNNNKKTPNNGDSIKVTSWWNDQCDRLIRLRRAAYLKFQQFSTRDNFITYIRIKAKVKIELRKAKKEYFKEFCCTLNRTTNLSYVWKKVKALANGLSRRENSNEYNEDAKNAVLHMIDDLCPPWVETCPPDLEDLPKDELFELPFSSEEFDSVGFR